MPSLRFKQPCRRAFLPKGKAVFLTGIVFFGFLLGTFLYTVQEAHAVRVSLKRVIFEGNKRSEVLTIINNTEKEQTYRLGWRKYRMDEKKPLQALEEGDKAAEDVLWADSMIRYAPRRVSIPPGGSQQIRLLFRRPADLQEAEYRSHLWIVTETKPEKFNTVQNGEQKQAFRLAVQPAISLPIFVRNGNLTAETSITDTKLTKSGDLLNMSFTLHRKGNRSVYGDFDFICTDGGKETVIKQVRGISVYTEIEKRFLNFEIDLSKQETKSCNNVKVLYRADPDDPHYKGATLAEGAASL